MFKYSFIIGLVCYVTSAEKEANTSISENVHLLSISENESGLSNGTNDSIDESEADSYEIIEGRVIGGQPARPGEFPYMARLTVVFSRNIVGVCTGTVLNDRIILTAAHCLYLNGRKASYVIAKVNHQLIFYSTSNMYIHPNYDESYADDIAILKSSNTRYLIRNFGVPPSLPTETIVNNLNVDTTATVAGFGKTSDKGQPSLILHYTNVNIISNDVCTLYFGDIITPNILCTLLQGKGICNGDSGGPLLTTILGNKYIIGISAFGANKCESFVPNGYTNVFQYIDWINSVIH